MQHIMIDSYGVNRVKLDDLSYIYDILNTIVYENNLESIMPPQLIPYYYGKEYRDSGISAYVLLKGGHITIHTFSYRECYFLDIVYDDFLDVSTIKEQLEELLPSKKLTVNETDRREKLLTLDTFEYSPEMDFGPHVIIEAVSDKILDFQKLFETLDLFPHKIGMTSIERPRVMFDSSVHKNYISGMTLIAESHISVHQNLESKNIYIDIFSCEAFDVSISMNIGEMLGIEIVNTHLIARGTKHAEIKSDDASIQAKYGSWLGNVY